MSLPEQKRSAGVEEGAGGRLPTITVVGGGAAGFFAAITAAEARPGARVVLLESGGRFLRKVRISGGGRCNVTHACFAPKELAGHYPRGSRELRAAFHSWQPRDTIEWFAGRGVSLKTEADGRMFPTTDDSRTIIDCLENSAREAGVEISGKQPVNGLRVLPEGGFRLIHPKAPERPTDYLCLAVGSLKGSPLGDELRKLGHTVAPLAPSLFAFDITDERLAGLAGLSVPDGGVRILPRGQPARGPVLVTHRGLSGPGILRLSAREARALREVAYRFEIEINWLGAETAEKLRERLDAQRKKAGGKTIKNTPIPPIPRRLWERLVSAAGIASDQTWAQLPGKKANALVGELLHSRFAVTGKTTNKEEFVTCGGIALPEIDFRTMASRKVPGLHFAGECLDLDGLTGGFNFQAAWTTGRLAGLAMAETSRQQLTGNSRED